MIVTVKFAVGKWLLLFISFCCLVNHYNADLPYHHDTYPLRYQSSSPPVRLSPQMSRNPPPYPTVQHMGSGDPHVYTTSQDSSAHKE